jgi:hypothetical protein
MASLHSPPLYSCKRVMGLPTLPSTTVEDDPYIAPAPKLPEQLLVSIETGAGHDKNEHVYPIHRGHRPAERRLMASHSLFRTQRELTIHHPPRQCDAS